MKIFKFLPLFPVLAIAQFNQPIITDDLSRFDYTLKKVFAAADTTEQKRLIREFYLEPATDGLKSLMLARNYSESELRKAIVDYPKYWASLSPKLSISKSEREAIQANIQKLKTAYPALRPAPIYFAVGAFRTPGTAFEGKVIIGGELSLADDETPVSEHPQWRRTFFSGYNPRNHLPLLCTHEYVHTQQKPLVYNLISMCIYEGVAEFISCKVTGLPSNSPAIAFGKANESRVVAHFVKDLFLMSNDYQWVWGENQNELKVRDLGYYIGYEIAERYYDNAADKKGAIAGLIELDYTDESAVEALVDNAKLLPKKLAELYDDYEKQRPTVVKIQPFSNGSETVESGTAAITFSFSEPLTGTHSGIDFGPLGADYFPKITQRVWSEDKKSMTVTVELASKKHYQFLIDNTFRKDDGVRLKPYLVEFTTK